MPAVCATARTSWPTRWRVRTYGTGPAPRSRLVNSGPARRMLICSRRSCASSRRMGTSRRLAPLPLVRAVDAVQHFAEDLDDLQLDYPQLRKFARAAHEFCVYIESNLDSLINYGERYRTGEPISSSIAESTVNTVISKRFAKRQQMQWTPRGAHLLLQTRTRTLDGTLRPLFERWHPGLVTNHASVEVERAAA